MAIQANKTQSSFTLKYKEGVDAKGKDIIKSQKFSKVKTTAADEDIFAVSEVLKTLIKYPVTQISRSDDNELVNV